MEGGSPRILQYVAHAAWEAEDGGDVLRLAPQTSDVPLDPLGDGYYREGEARVVLTLRLDAEVTKAEFLACLALLKENAEDLYGYWQAVRSGAGR